MDILIGFEKLNKKKFKTNDKSIRFHKNDENLMQIIFQIISAYFIDDCIDADKFMESPFHEYMERGIKTYLRSDSGFSSPKLYKTCEMNSCIRLVHGNIQDMWFSKSKNHMANLHTSIPLS